MPKQGSRLFRNLNRSFGVKGAPDPRELALEDFVQPTLDADRYDPPAKFFFGVNVPGVAMEFSAWELVAPRGGLRVGHLTTAADLSVRISIERTAPGLTPVTGPFASFQGIVPETVVATGNLAVALAGPVFTLVHELGMDVNAFVPEGFRFVLSGLIAALGMNVQVYWVEPTNTGAQ